VDLDDLLVIAGLVAVISGIAMVSGAVAVAVVGAMLVVLGLVRARTPKKEPPA
jgi:NAD(P)H-hydrate repair Nnr-like enzyme with NAD(P)H-hydrate dehydratase domain